MLTPFGPSFGEGFASIPTAKLIIEYSKLGMERMSLHYT